LVQRKNQVYAMKTIRKDLLLEKTLIEHCLLEKEVLMNTDHPFMVNMEYVFQTENRIFFIMRFVRGGELYRHLRAEKHFSEKRAKFYVMQVALAIGHLHSMNVVYRDLKPENILMDTDGYIRLTDFGLSKSLERSEDAYTFCGTPQYLAPEILAKNGHNKPVDWWTLGILTYELIVGFTPFYCGGDT